MSKLQQMPMTKLQIKVYVDKKSTESETAAGMIYASKIELGDYLKKDGSVSMTGDLNMGSKKITNLKAPKKLNEGMNKKYMDDALSLKASTASVLQLSVKKADKTQLDDYLKRDGTKEMKGKLIMDSHKITNVFMDSSPGALDATSRDYVDNLMHHSQVQPSHQKDEFAYLMANMLEWTDLTSGGGNGFNMTKIANLSTSKGNFHSNNKKVIYTTIIKKRSRRIQVQNGNSMLQIAKKLFIMPSVLRF